MGVEGKKLVDGVGGDWQEETSRTFEEMATPICLRFIHSLRLHPRAETSLRAAPNKNPGLRTDGEL